MVSLHPHVLDPFWNISNEGFACTSWERLWLPYLHTSLLRWSSTFGSLFKTLPVDLYIGKWVHITFFKIHITIKIKHQAVQAADCDLRSQNAANARVPSTLPRQLYISTIFRPHPKTMKVSICQLPGNFSEVWTFPLTLVLKPHLWACPGNKALIVCLSCSSPRKEHASLGLSGHNPLTAVTEEGPLYSETFY